MTIIMMAVVAAKFEAVECHEVFVSTGLSDVCKIEIKLSK